MIGVECRPIDGALRHQLGIEHGVVVNDVFNDTPAKEAGIENHDILLDADGVALTEVSDLVDLVQAAGVEGSKVNLVVLRKGEKQTISMKTKKRRDSNHSPIFSQDGDQFDAGASVFRNVDRLKSFDEELKESVEAELEETFKTRKKSKEYHF
jgi:C-terminal processing protease CtpA/Prc